MYNTMTLLGGSVLANLDCEDYICQRIQSGATHSRISIELQQLYPGIRGLSSRSIRRFCSERGIHYSSSFTNSQVENLVEQSVAQVGPSYGRRTLSGLLRSRGIVIGEQRVRRAMLQTTPVYVAQRQRRTYRLLNPVPYYAEYFGHKIHFDQNEKLTSYGVTHVAASDGYSGKLLGIVSMPIQNNHTIYDDLFRPIILQYGVWDQVRVDCGREFALILFVQSHLASYRTNTERRPYLQTQSTQNHLAERHWVEVNSRVNYPVKTALRWMEQMQEIDMDCPTTKFCVSVMAGKLCQVGLQNHISAWNNHRIPGPHRGIPNRLAAENNRTGVLLPSNVPSLHTAVEEYQATGGCLSQPGTFGMDPLSLSRNLCTQRTLALDSNILSPEDLFAYTVHGFHQPFMYSLRYFIDVTNQLSAFV